MFIQSSLHIWGKLFPGPLQVPNTEDAQVTYIKGCSTVGPLYPQVSIHGFKEPIIEWNTIQP